MTNPYLYYIIIRHVIGVMCAQPQKCFTLGIFLCSYVVAECSQTLGCSQTSGECTSTGTSPYLNNSLFISSHLSHFIKQKIFQWEHGNKYNWGSSPAYRTRVLLLGEIPQNTQRNKKGVFYIVRFPYCRGLLQNLLFKFSTKILLLFNKSFQSH